MANQPMYWKPDGLSGAISGIRAAGPPDRSLLVTVIIRNRFDVPVVLWRSRVSAQIGGVRVAEGDFVYAHYATIQMMALAPGAENPGGKIRIPMSREAIAAVERFRKGPVEMNLTVHCWLAPVLNGVLGIPWENIMSAPYGNAFLPYEIPTSEWIKYLSAWEYADVQVFEVPGEFRTARLSGAWKRWEEAVEAFRLGDYENVLASCYRGIEAAARVVTTEESEKADLKVIATLISSPEKAPLYDRLILEFNKLLHKGRHDQGHTGIVPDRRDAYFALGVTHAILSRLA